ncbi:MAG: hypothetical protein GXZ07_10890 [Firmicutes bacterium]|nr:hypothetical protein [Bacillota bacterium]
MKKKQICCMLLLFSLMFLFLPAAGAEAFRAGPDRGGFLVNPPSGEISPGQPNVPAEPADPGTPPSVPTPSQPGSGGSRFSRTDRGYVPDPTPGRGTVVPSNPSVPEPDDPASPPSQETPDIPAPPSWLNANEAKAYTLLNETRIKHNLKPVNISYQLTEVARMKARDMIDNDYFDHTSPTYGSIGTMLRNAGVSFKMAAENLSKAGNINQCHLQLEYSTKGHRQIMLSPNYNNVGIGVLSLKNVPGILMVQIFTD